MANDYVPMTWYPVYRCKFARNLTEREKKEHDAWVIDSVVSSTIATEQVILARSAIWVTPENEAGLTKDLIEEVRNEHQSSARSWVKRGCPKL